MELFYLAPQQHLNVSDGCFPPCRAPEMCVVAFKSTDPRINIYTVNDLLSRKGWHLNALQHPAALHICFTAAHDQAAVEALLQASCSFIL
jgi:hypothetical protein